jgi:membrane-associated protease RseP (regulator of RpoE activity)
MVGRAKENRLFVGGTGTSPAWPALVERCNEEAKFALTLWPGGKAPSDHQSFYEKRLPVLFFFTGIHPDYHRPSDDWNTLDYRAHERVARLAAAVVLDVATRPDRPAFVPCDAGGFEVGPYLGLSFEQRPEGVVVVHVAKGSPAGKAGFREDDVLLEWNDLPLPDANSVNDAISRSKPKEKVTVVVRRKGKTVTLRATLGGT